MTRAATDEDPFYSELEFELPGGWVDDSGTAHTDGSMRPATARDELLPLMDPRVRADPGYLTVVVLARVVTRLGPLSGDAVTAEVMESLYAGDLAFLQELYAQLNASEDAAIQVGCPSCGHRFAVELPGRSSA